MNEKSSCGTKFASRCYTTGIYLLVVALFWDDIENEKEVKMQKFIDSLKDSAQELKKLHSLSVMSMLTAMQTVLGLFTIMIGEFIKIGFSFLTLALAGMLYGPVAAGILGGLGDILNYLIKPAGPFFPGFTVSAVLSGFIYGFFLYKKPVSIRQVFFAKLIIVIFVDLFLSTIWLSLLWGKVYWVLLPMRALKAVIMLPIETGILYIVLTRITAIFHLKNFSLGKCK